jgi:hypothetical protein
MAEPIKLLICSDIHYASDAEKARTDYELRAVPSPGRRFLLRLYRHYVWQRDPFAHNHLLQRVLDHPEEPDVVVANGDYSCDSAFIGVADPAARESARQCLGQLRERFGAKFLAVFGDHELGKFSLCGEQGGLRLESFQRAQSDLNLEPCWTKRIGGYVLIGMTSSLAAMQVYETEALPEEREQWRELSREHLNQLKSVFSNIRPDERILLFCHDPTALPFLWEIEEIRKRTGQIERTVIGHLHSRAVLWQSSLLRGVPKITFCGAAVHRISAALSRSRVWRHFNLLLCPALAGVELFKRGGYYSGEIDPGAEKPARFQLHTVRR